MERDEVVQGAEGTVKGGTMIQATPRHRRIASSRPADAVAVRDRIAKLLRTEVEFIANQSFQRLDAELEREVLQGEVVEPSIPSAVPKNLPAHLARMCETSILTREEERELFRRLNYLKYRANMLRSRLDPQHPDVAMLERAERFLAAAMAIRDRLVKANMRLAISVVKKFVTPRHSFDDLLSEGTYSLMQAVDKFDYDRGFRFSTYAYRAIARNAYRMITKRQKEAVRFSSEMEESSLELTVDRCLPLMDVNTWERLRNLLSKIMHRLDRREQLIIRCRYALGPHRKVKTFQAIAEKLGVSKERVRQLEQRHEQVA